jgi:hypothetical protein
LEYRLIVKKYERVALKINLYAYFETFRIIFAVGNFKKPMAKASIKTVASTETACIFSLCFEGESFTEFEKFVMKHKTHYSKELNVILAAINRMLEVSGFLERYFRPEGKMRDNVCALPIHCRREACRRKTLQNWWAKRKLRCRAGSPAGIISLWRQSRKSPRRWART